MRFVLLAAAALSACALVSDRVETMSHAPSFHAKVLAIAAVRGGNDRAARLSQALSKRLEEFRLRASSLEDADSVLAGSALGLETASDPHVLAEIRRATGAEAVVFLTLDPGWKSLDVSVLDTATGDVVLRATARPRGDAFESADDAAQAAAEALSSLSSEPRRAASFSGEAGDEIPFP